MINAINSIDKHSLREVECEIYVYGSYTVVYMKKGSRNIYCKLRYTCRGIGSFKLFSFNYVW